MPSIVVTFLPSTWLTGVIHEWVGVPSTCTRHTAHSPMPQPNFVPVSFRSSGGAHNRGEWLSAWITAGLSLTSNLYFFNPVFPSVVVGALIAGFASALFIHCHLRS